MAALDGTVVEEDAVVGKDPDAVAEQVCIPAHERRAIGGLVLVEAAAVDEATDDLAHFKGLLDIIGEDAVEVIRVEQRCFRVLLGLAPLGRAFP